MVVIGLTGISGSGKGYVSGLFARRGIPSIDTDGITHTLYEPGSDCVRALTEQFDRDILQPDGSVNRAKLAEMVFSDPEKLAQLNKIVHRYILEEVRTQIAAYAAKGVGMVLVDAPQLFESGFDRECQYTLAVEADPEIRIERICKRDGRTREQALKRIQNQHEDAFFRQHCDFVIRNNGTEDPEEQIDKVLAVIESEVAG
ncbi:MAG: dephospho-CoA kinase [Eubacteriales bacterium]